MKEYFCPELTITLRVSGDIVTMSPADGDNFIDDDFFDDLEG